MDTKHINNELYYIACCLCAELDELESTMHNKNTISMRTKHEKQIAYLKERFKSLAKVA